VKIKDVIQAVRDKVNDPDGKYWSDVEVCRWIDHHNRQLHRYRAQADRSYGRVLHQVLASDTDRVRSVKEDVQRYHFPSWIYKIYGVRDMTGGTNKRGSLIDYREHPRDSNKGWYVSTDGAIDLVGYNSAIDLELDVSKLPTSVHYGTVDSPSANARNKIRLDSVPQDGASTPNTFPLDWQVDAYVGMEIEVVSGSTETTNRRGTVAQVISQEHKYDADLSKWTVELTVFPQWPTPIQTGDQYELHVPLDESNYEFLSARVARSLFHKTRNMEGIASLEGIMVEGYDNFLAGLRPRQEQQPGFLVDPGEASTGYFNPDKDYSGDWD